MGFFRNQMRSVIEWTNPSKEVLIWQWDGTNDELKNSSKLIVNPGQLAIFVYEGDIKAIHDYPGVFELRTSNIPFWTTLTKFMQGFESEHKARIYFVQTLTFTNLKWGTKTPVKYNDPVYKFPVGMRAFGNFSFKISKVREFFTNFAGIKSQVYVDDIRTVINDRIMQNMTTVFAKAGYSYAEIDSHRMDLAKALSEQVAPEFLTLGFEMQDFRIESTDFDEQTQERINKISDKIADVHSINAMSGINAGAMDAYAKTEQLEALKMAAKNEGGMAGLGAGIGAGLGLGGLAATGFAATNTQQPASPMAACPSCSAQVAASAKFCPECGNSMSGEKTCQKCNAKSKNAKFCPECGEKF
ncbi:MAG: SPFH domain-containing protein [Candidatus Riflebacteria bacterium]|nr:SPFH domain-containing protein [Candidatus Riflebacteria bacterium]